LLSGPLTGCCGSCEAGPSWPCITW
jgi:hypothetical protein